jgi:hypothetical protein
MVTDECRVVTVGEREQLRSRDGGTSDRTASWLAWSLCAVCVALIALAFLLNFVTDIVPVQPEERPDPGVAVLSGVLSLVFSTVGALIASRLPANPVGWIFCIMGLLFAAQRFSITYADYALVENLAFPGGQDAAWFSTWVGFANRTLGVFLILLFPNGQLPSRRWRIVAWAALLGAALTAVADAFTLRQLPTHPYVFNPYGVAGPTGDELITYQFFVTSSLLGNALLLISALVALLSLFLRLYRARGDERLRIKWFLLAAVPAVVCVSLIVVQGMVYDFTAAFLFNSVSLISFEVYNALLYVAVFALLLVPVCTYIAISKHGSMT